jgi:hypothetical protein
MLSTTPRGIARVLGTVTGLLLMGLATPAHAIDLGFRDFQMHGFASQGYTYTSANDFFGNSQGAGSLEFTELGMNVLGHPFPNLLFAAQGSFRDTAGSDEDDFRLDYANLDFSLPLRDDLTLGVRGGRVRNPFGLYSETRDVIWTRPSVLLPQSLYFDSLGLRTPELASDGGILYGRYRFGDHAFTAEFLAADPNTETATPFLTTPFVSGTLGGRPILIGRAGYDWQEGRFRLLFTAVDFDHDFEPSSSAALPGNVKLFAPIVSAQVNLEDWSFTGEYLRTGIRRTGIFREEFLDRLDPVARKFFLDNTAESYYLQVQYRFAPAWSAIARYDAFFQNSDDHDGSATARGTGLPRHRFYAKDLTFGLRWEFLDDWLVAAEYHNVDGTGWLSPIDNPGINDPARVREVSDGHWDLFALMFSYRF